jgi:uncharacterized protein YjgD (DUF1641 family)
MAEAEPEMEETRTAPSAEAADGDNRSGLEGYASLLKALDGAVTDAGVERMVDAFAPWLAVAGSPDVRELAAEVAHLAPHLTRFARRLRPMVEAGLLDRLVELMGLAGAVLDAVTPLQAERLAVELEGLATLANNVMTEDPAIVWRSSLERILGTWEEGGEARPLGLGDLLRLRRDPGVQRALRAMLALVRTPEGDGRPPR